MKNIDDSIKEEINREGYDGNCAVLIGTPEEMLILKEKLESGGYTNNLETYIRLNKKIELPVEIVKTNQEIYDWVSKNKGKIWENRFSYLGLPFTNVPFRYIDKDGNIASVIVDPEKIKSLESVIINPNEEPYREGTKNYFNLGKNRGLDQAKMQELLSEELTELGFTLGNYSTESNILTIHRLIENLEKERKYYKEIEKEEKFDF